MSFSLADQLATIRIYPMLLTAMRRFGVISSWDASRGFGEIELPSVRQRMFCHISGRLGAPGRPLRAGDPVLFLIGSDGGDTALAFSRRRPGTFLTVPFVGLSDEAAVPVGSSLADLVGAVSYGE